MSLNVGDKAPDFNLPADGGSKLSLKSLKGKTVILYFYPKDDTPGCTTEAQAFRDEIKKFDKAGAVIVGASKDSVARHNKFKAKHALPFHLVSDEDGTLCEAYGTWIKKKLYGREYLGIARATFLIDGRGVIREIWPKVKVKGHADEVLAAVKALKAPHPARDR
ncbi:MAG: thioredoxin-dependent thiol peroxidase [Rhodospirillaceae bacterium]